MTNKSVETKNGPAADAPEPTTTNPYLADALERIERVRAILEGFPKTPALAPLTRGQLGHARRATLEALQKAARFAEERPHLSAGLTDVRELNDATDFLVAYEGLRERMSFALRDLDQIMIEVKYAASRAARALYRMGRAYAVSVPDPDQGPVQAQVGVLKEVFGRRRAVKPAKPADPDVPAVKK